MVSEFAIGDVTMGGFTSGYLIKQIYGFDFPQVRTDVKDRGNYHGATFGAAFYGRRIMAIEGEIIASDTTDFETKRRALQSAVDLYDGLKTLRVFSKSGLTLQSDVVVNSAFDSPYKAGMAIRCDFRIEFVAPFPFLESYVEKSVDVAILNGGGGEVPMEIPFSLALGSSVQQLVENEGNAHAFPTIRIYGTIADPTLTNETTGETLSITQDLAGDSDYIDLDFYNRTAVLNGTTNIMQYVSGDWFTLKPGQNSIKLTGSSANSHAVATLSYRDSYLGV